MRKFLKILLVYSIEKNLIFLPEAYKDIFT